MSAIPFRVLGLAALLAVIPARPSPAVQDTNPWPLVKAATGSVWGELVAAETWQEDRILTVRLLDGGVIRLRERAGALVEATRLWLGATGLFLTRPAATVDGAPPVEAWLVPGGFLPLDPGAAESQRLRGLVGRTADGATAQAGFELLAASDPLARRVALGCLLEAGALLPAVSVRDLAVAFAREGDPRNQSLFLHVFLLHGWDHAGTTPADLILRGCHPHVEADALRYLAAHGTARDRARLLEAFPGVGEKRKASLLRSYGRLGITEATPWFREALLSDDWRLARIALEELTAWPESEEIYIALLESNDPEVRRLGVQGLGARATPAAREALTRFVQRRGDDPDARFAQEVLRHPYRHGRLPYHREPLRGREEGRR